MGPSQLSVTFSAFEKCVLALILRGDTNMGHVLSHAVEHVCVVLYSTAGISSHQTSTLDSACHIPWAATMNPLTVIPALRQQRCGGTQIM